MLLRKCILSVAVLALLVPTVTLAMPTNPTDGDLLTVTDMPMGTVLARVIVDGTQRHEETIQPPASSVTMDLGYLGLSGTYYIHVKFYDASSNLLETRDMGWLLFY